MLKPLNCSFDWDYLPFSKKNYFSRMPFAMVFATGPICSSYLFISLFNFSSRFFNSSIFFYFAKIIEFIFSPIGLYSVEILLKSTFGIRSSFETEDRTEPKVKIASFRFDSLFSSFSIFYCGESNTLFRFVPAGWISEESTEVSILWDRSPFINLLHKLPICRKILLKLDSFSNAILVFSFRI